MVLTSDSPAHAEASLEGGKESRARIRLLEGVGEWARLIPFIGVALYTLLWTAASSFYSRLGIDPQDVGVDYASILVKSSGQIILLGLAAAYLVFYWRVRRVVQNPRSIRLAAVGLIGVVLLVLWLGGLLWLATYHASGVRDGRIEPTTRLFFPIVPWRVWPAEVASTGTGAPTLLREVTEHCVFFMGQSDGVTVLFDVQMQRSLRIPSSQIDLATQSRGQRPTCPE
jgi:hypothetical protein